MPSPPPNYMRRAGLYWRRGNQDAFVAGWAKQLVKIGQADIGDAFLTGYRKAATPDVGFTELELYLLDTLIRDKAGAGSIRNRWPPI
jgi:hypothetical protein